MATIVQSKAYNGAGATSHTITLDSAATNGNDIILVCVGNANGFSGASTFNGSNMTSDYQQFDLYRIARFRVTAGGTDCVTALTASDTLRAMLFEVSGLTSSPFEASTNDAASGEGTATDHTLGYAAGAADRCFFGMVAPGTGVTVTGTGGATAYACGGNRHVLFKDALGSSAGSADCTLSSSTTVQYFSATYLTTGGGGSSGTPRQMMHFNRQRRA